MATFTRLRDNTWGVRVDLFTERAARVGETLRVFKRDGTYSTVTIAAVLYTKRYGKAPYQLCAVAPKPAPVSAVPATAGVSRYSRPVDADEPDPRDDGDRWHPTDEPVGHPARETYDEPNGYDNETAPNGHGDGADRRNGADTDDAERTVPLLPSERLAWHAPTRTFTVELSDIRDLTRDLALNEIDVRSAKTGNVVRFVVSRVDRDRENELRAYELMSEGDLGIKLVLIND